MALVTYTASEPKRAARRFHAEQDQHEQSAQLQRRRQPERVATGDGTVRRSPRPSGAAKRE